MRVFSNLNFRRLWIGSVTSAAGAAVGAIILTWLVYSATHSPLAISALGIVQFIPTLAFGLLAGALIDRLDRRRLMVTCDAGRAACFGGLAVYVLLYGASTVTLIGVVFVVATFSTVFRPATNAAIPRIVPAADLSDANGVLQGATTIAQFVGSPIGSLIVVTVGATVGFALNALTFAVSGTMIFLMVIPSGTGPAPAPSPPRRSLLQDVKDGLEYLRSQRALLIITLTAMVANFFLTFWGGFVIIYAVQHLHQGAYGFAILVAANTAGFAVGAILPGRLHTGDRPGIWLLRSWGIVGFLILGLAWTDSLPVALGLTVGAGLLLSLGNTTWLAGVQRTVPDQYLGRYFATDEAGSFAMIPAGLAVAGVLVLAFGITWTYVIAGVGTLAANAPLFVSRTVRSWGRSST